MCTFQPMLRATPNVSISMRTKVEHSATAVKRGGVKRRVVHNSQSWGFCREREVNEPGSRRAATYDVDRPRLRVKTQSTCTWRRQLWSGFRPFSDRDERQVCANSGPVWTAPRGQGLL